MSADRSPTRSDLASARSGSYPNLPSKINASQLSELSQVTVRNKRKFIAENEELKAEFSDVKHEFIELSKQMTALHLQMSEMMTYVTSNNTMQIDNFSKISEDVSVIKNQVNDIKSTTEFLIEEQSKLKLEIMNIKSSNNTTQKKVELLESRMQNIDLKMISVDASPKVKAQEEIITELNERNLRSRNILVSGIAESTCTDPKERQIHDRNASWSILKTIYTDCPQPEKVYRIGKYNPDKNRLIKVCFELPKTALYILRNKSSVKNDVNKIYPDQTSQQQSYMKHLKEELEARTRNGETNLIIKYVRGVPKIISAPPKTTTNN
ncbi:uncharacterized protein [Maniola hyperantus]|uniref:uncharacterized protein n=1 Tax=Aphantopus hyperantus TaxID=2795564 RepID=UPI0037490063